MLRYIVIAVIVLICIGFLIGYLLLKWKEDGAGIFEKKDGFQGDWQMMILRSWKK